MPVYRGNVGNLLQHWVLCEVIQICHQVADHVAFADAYSMAPLANVRPKRDVTAPLFDFVRDRLPGDYTLYERAWNRLARDRDTYPNSAAFLADICAKRYSLVLCESEPDTLRQLKSWADQVGHSPRCMSVEIAGGDWRDRFRQGLALAGDVALLSFDPYMIDIHGSGRNPGNIVPDDFELIGNAISRQDGAVVIQLSTYSANNANPQTAVMDFVTSRLGDHGIQLVAVARADGNMMSLLLGRDLGPMPTALEELPSRFDAWLSDVKANYRRLSQPRVGKEDGNEL